MFCLDPNLLLFLRCLKMIAKNNIFNIRFNAFNHWMGQDGFKNGFCTFEHPKFGIRAVFILLCRSYRRKGIFNIEQIVSRFAPTNENDTENYINIVCSQTGYDRRQSLDTILMYYYVIKSMALIETGTLLSLSDLKKVANEFNIKLYKIR